MSEASEVFKRLVWVAKEFGYKVTVHADWISVTREGRVQDSKSSANFTRGVPGYEQAIKWLQAKAQRGEL